MTKTLATIGPVSEGKNLRYIVDRADLIRLNMSHNSIKWHNKNINEIKKIDSHKLILVDIPGIKPITLNKDSIHIKKGDIVKFGNDKKIKNIIQHIKKTLKGGFPLFGEIKLRKDEILKLYPSISKAKKIINWKPKIPFEIGLKSTIKFYNEQEQK